MIIGSGGDFLWHNCTYRCCGASTVCLKHRNEQGLAEEQEKQNELKRKDGRMLQEDGWKCICGQLNASYVGTCSCGRTRADVEDLKKKKSKNKIKQGNQNGLNSYNNTKHY